MKKYKFSGISIVYGNDGSKTPHFHVSKIEGRIGVWMDVPGKVEFHFIELPEPMTKLDAIAYLHRHREFQVSYVNKYLGELLLKNDPEESGRKKERGIKSIRNTTKKRSKSKNTEEESSVEIHPVEQSQGEEIYERSST